MWEACHLKWNRAVNVMTLMQIGKEAKFYFCCIRSVSDLSLSLSLCATASGKRGSLAHCTAPECFFFNCWRQSHGYLLQHSSLMGQTPTSSCLFHYFQACGFSVLSTLVARVTRWWRLVFSLSPLAAKDGMETENRKSVNGVAWSMWKVHAACLNGLVISAERAYRPSPRRRVATLGHGNFLD